LCFIFELCNCELHEKHEYWFTHFFWILLDFWKISKNCLSGFQSRHATHVEITQLVVMDFVWCMGHLSM